MIINSKVFRVPDTPNLAVYRRQLLLFNITAPGRIETCCCPLSCLLHRRITSQADVTYAFLLDSFDFLFCFFDFLFYYPVLLTHFDWLVNNIKITVSHYCLQLLFLTLPHFTYE